MQTLLLSDKLRLCHVGPAFQGERAWRSTLPTKPHSGFVKQLSRQQSRELRAAGDPHPGLPTLAPIEGK